MNVSSSEKILYETVVEGGWNFSCIVRRGRGIRLTDLEGGANISALFYNADNFTERYNMGDTLKIQHISTLSKHACIYSSRLPWKDRVGRTSTVRSGALFNRP